MIIDIAKIILLTFIPTLELRASIPFGIIATEIHWLWVFIIAVISNILLGAVLYALLDIIIKQFTKIRIINKLYCLYVKRTQKKINKYVEKYGELGIAFFIAVPLPGSGSYTGAMAAYLLGMKYRKFLLANTIGVLIAGTLVTIIVLSGISMLNILVKY